ncbi:ornithine cyclodeaminase family protein [Ahrensia sp. R2A130]|uniref:ornithine cyclodeaminase family protein n=1 Tax=Ahrensia sp. R2A130 TaxID=744979 RepID=UPI0001E09C68|nr:ornithine cyclodeaminase [Ahrensia sp. R2A130]EFL88595.1 ornithine cyclodeaminase/mu-crystallin [Ahrensia sp. R2A130]
MTLTLSADDVNRLADWPGLIEALRAGHRGPKASIGDSFVHARDNTMLVRSAWVPGLAAGVKAATVVPENRDRDLPSIHAQIMLFDDATGQLTALVDGTAVTAWKTAADSALGCDLLARKDAKTLLMVGAGAMAAPLIAAHRTARPGIERVLIWNRTAANAEALAQTDAIFEVASDLPAAMAQADIICCATMSSEPVIQGANVRPGTHVDLVGAYRIDMREADDELHRRGTWFVDSFDTTLDHIGELAIPLKDGTITRDAVKGDLHALVDGVVGRQSDEEITVFKNGGGAHLDVMIAMALCEKARAEG